VVDRPFGAMPHVDMNAYSGTVPRFLRRRDNRRSVARCRLLGGLLNRDPLDGRRALMTAAVLLPSLRVAAGNNVA
jgi:hypothetical protein